ncbi:2-iminobutanoate/2-iminopropanoate deaminase-like [Cylas formicarius]|uniref:2-iminobutanoate/2-iminopropanoate deaminase-like n=1 Tax=Cylas formicarius TaxID=197179 RepID=UPI002958B9F0|nr:2-iminobutanoate/2-iminopropanoate deaminase-like [Cylas formicarius]
MTSLIRRIVRTARAPKPVAGAPYNQAVVFNGTVYLSGVLGINTEMKLVPGGAAAEARQALTSIGHILDAAGSSFENVLKSTIMLNDIADFGAVNDVYKEFFRANFPSRSTYQVGRLPMGASVEIEVTAVVGDVETITSKM